MKDIKVGLDNNDTSGETLFQELYNEMFPVIYRIAMKMTGNIHRSEDICHETFLRFIESPPSTQRRDQIKFWLIKVCKNLTLNQEKKSESEKTAYIKLQGLALKAQASSEEDYLKIHTELIVQKALDLIPKNLKIVLVLKEYEGLTYKEIGSIIGASEANVKVRVYRGRAKLYSILKELESNVP